MRVTSKASSAGTASVSGVGKPVGPTGVASPSVSPTSITTPLIVGDALSVSGTAQFIAVAQAHLAKVPDIRTDKVDALKARMESDEYHPDGEAVADGLVRDHTPLDQEP